METQTTRALQPRVVIFGGPFLLVLTLVLFLAVLTPTANAAFPGNNGKIAFASDRSGSQGLDIWVMNSDGTNLVNLTNNTGDDMQPVWSPDGTKIAFASGRASNWDIYVMNADGTGLIQLTTNLASDSAPAWSPDGKYIAFSSFRLANNNNDYEIFVMPSDGGEAVSLLRSTFDTAKDYDPAWSPDGSWIAFSSDRGGNENIWVAHPNGTGLTQLTTDPAVDSDPSWSPDGYHIAFTSNRGGNYGIYTMNADGSGQGGFVTDPVSNIEPFCSPDGSQVAFARDYNGSGKYYIYTRLSGGSYGPVFSDSASDRYPDWQPQPNYHWTWYDNIGGDNWVLMANPASATRNLNFGLSVGGIPVDLSGYNSGVVTPGQSITPKYSGLMAGPVKATSTSGGYGITSQRILWPKGGNSLEEVLGTAESRLSSRFFWSWYDQLSPGFTNWVLLSNPGSGSVYYEITIAGADPGTGSTGTITSGSNVNLTFPGKMGGPVEVNAWTDSSRTISAKIMASQRVLSNNGGAFNEVPGIPAEELSSIYTWTWYDDLGGSNWVLIANPSPISPLYYEMQVGKDGCSVSPPPGTACLKDNGTPIPPGGYITPRLGVMNGPMFLATYSNALHNSDALSIASQRSLWGPSFEEVPGMSYQGLNANYHWTWYDQRSAGATNWVLLANPDPNDTIKVEIWMNGQQAQEGVGPSATPTTWTLAPGEKVTPRFGSYMGGPVEVRAYINNGAWNGNNGGDNRQVIASQRVLWNGYFNEVLGTVVN